MKQNKRGGVQFTRTFVVNKEKNQLKKVRLKKERMIFMKYSGTAMFIPVIFFTLFFEKVFYDIMRYRFYIASEKMLKIREKLEDKKDVRIN